MESKYKIQKIGTVQAEQGMFAIQLEPQFIDGLTNLEGFSCLQVVWWGHLHDSEAEREKSLVIPKPYKASPDQLGVFATRSQVRPNPILITSVHVIRIDKEAGKIYIPYIDADPGTEVLDIKPYHKIERIRECEVPEWCNHWPDWYEEAATFNWAEEFNF
jgi:tRNA (Thr-GGU) A37 N-methylase